MLYSPHSQAGLLTLLFDGSVQPIQHLPSLQKLRGKFFPVFMDVRPLQTPPQRNLQPSRLLDDSMLGILHFQQHNHKVGTCVRHCFVSISSFLSLLNIRSSYDCCSQRSLFFLSVISDCRNSGWSWSSWAVCFLCQVRGWEGVPAKPLQHDHRSNAPTAQRQVLLLEAGTFNSHLTVFRPVRLNGSIIGWIPPGALMWTAPPASKIKWIVFF